MVVKDLKILIQHVVTEMLHNIIYLTYRFAYYAVNKKLSGLKDVAICTLCYVGKKPLMLKALMTHVQHPFAIVLDNTHT